jgi:hypothetical protein
MLLVTLVLISTALELVDADSVSRSSTAPLHLSTRVKL